jgi:hypothetical protein
MSYIRRVLPLLAVLALLATLLVGTAPAAHAAIGDGCLSTSQPGGWILCGYHQDGPWTFQSGRTVTCWAGIQLQPPAFTSWQYRVWHKCHAVGVQGTVVPSTAVWRDIRRIHWQFSTAQNGDILGTACTTSSASCVKDQKENYWTGAWQLLNLDQANTNHAWSTDAHVVVSIQNTNDKTSDHCVSSYKWTAHTADGVPVC